VPYEGWDPRDIVPFSSNAPALGVPEPGTFVLLTSGALGLLACAWRKRGGR